MTTIRRITVSQIDGNSSNSTDTNEIRPFGETAFYLDTDGNTDKLVLMMFDGTRTHLKSKVLSPGELYGSNADSGDGNNYDTLKLIPDAQLKYNGSDQYIVVDPTGGEPGHIHLRAGGTQDASSADLYLGGELTCVRVSDTSNIVTIRTTNVGDPNITMDWSFQPDGNLYFPGIGNNRIGESEPGLVISSDASVVLQSNNNGVSNEWFFGTNGVLQIPGTIAGTGGISIIPDNAETFAYLNLPSDANSAAFGVSLANDNGKIELRTNNQLTSTAYTWKFDNDGTLTFPDTTIQTTAWAGGRVVSVPASSIGATGDKQGDMAFNGSYIYYCTQDFVEASYSSTIVLTYSGTFPSIVKGSIPQPQAGWVLIHNGNTYTLDANAFDGNPGQWVLSLSSSISVTIGDSVTVGPASAANIWKRVAWSVDTW